MPNRLGPKRLSSPLSTVWQIAHCRTKAALPLAASPSARLEPAPRQARAAAIAASRTPAPRPAGRPASALLLNLDGTFMNFLPGFCRSCLALQFRPDPNAGAAWRTYGLLAQS